MCQSPNCKHRDDKRARLMWFYYQRGNSLAQVGEKFGVTRQSVYGIFKTRGWTLRSRGGKSVAPVEWNGRKYAWCAKGYYRSSKENGQRRTALHRDIWEFHNGPIPDGYEVWRNSMEVPYDLEDLVLTKKTGTLPEEYIHGRNQYSKVTRKMKGRINEGADQGQDR